MIDYKNRRMSEIAPMTVVHKKEDESLSDMPGSENQLLLDHARQLWDDLYDFRQRTRRAHQYHEGDQWGDYMQDPDGSGYIREDEYIRSQGRVPLKQNIIRQLIKNLQGQYRNNPTKTLVYARNREDAALSEIMSNAIHSVHDINYTEQLDAQNFLQMAVSGMAVSRLEYSYIHDKDKEDVELTNVDPSTIFFNSNLRDPRLPEINTIGQLHELTIDEVIGKFADTPADEKRIRRWYSTDYYRDYIQGVQGLTGELGKHVDFYIASNPGMCRVIEIWYKKAAWKTYVHDYADGSYDVIDASLEDVEAMNMQRIYEAAEFGIPAEEVPLMDAKRKYDQDWYVKYLTPYGHELFAGVTPYEHGEHPYVMALYPLINGKVWGMVEDIIDQQRYVNRAITLMDFIIGASAKGVLLVHEDSVPESSNLADFADNWTKVNGVIVYKGKGVPIPQQISNSSVPVGLQEMLSMQLKLSYDIMGIHQAIQGQQAKSGTPSSLYAQEAQNATMNIRDFMDTFVYYKDKRDGKLLKLILQYYDEPRSLMVSGVNYAPEARIYDPEKLRDVEYDHKVIQGQDTPVYRAVIEDTLMNLLGTQLIDLEMYLEHSTMPYADKLLESIRRKRQEIEQNITEGEGDPALMQGLSGAQTGADPRLQGMMNQMMGQ